MSSILSRLNEAEHQRNTQAAEESIEVQIENFVEQKTQSRSKLFALLLLIALGLAIYITIRVLNKQPETRTVEQQVPVAKIIDNIQPKAENSNEGILEQAFILEGLLFVEDDQSLNKAVINGKLLKQGQLIQPNVRVQQIGEDWVQLNVKGKVITIR